MTNRPTDHATPSVAKGQST